MSHEALGSQFDPEKFSIVSQGPSPLDYRGNDRWGHPERLAVVHPDATEHPPGDLGFAEISRMRTRASNGRPLKTPKREVMHPAAAPGTVAFADVSEVPGGGVFVNYIKTRQDMRGQGHASRLVDHIYTERRPTSVDWGKVMNEDAAALMEKHRQKNPDVPVRFKKFW